MRIRRVAYWVTPGRKNAYGNNHERTDILAKTERLHVPTAPGAKLKDAPVHLSKQEFGRRLHEKLLALNMRPAELARRANLSRNNISAYINGRSYPSRTSLQAVAKALSCDPDDLLPNFMESAIRGEQMPGFQIKSSVADPGTAWLTINRQVSIAAAMAIGKILADELIDEKKRT